MPTLTLENYQKIHAKHLDEALELAKVILDGAPEEFSTEENPIYANGKMTVGGNGVSKFRLERLLFTIGQILFTNGWEWNYKMKKCGADRWEVSGMCLRLTKELYDKMLQDVETSKSS